VQRRLGSTGGIAQIAIGEGEERKLSDGDFHASTLDAVAGKGTDPDVAEPTPLDTERHHELSVGYDSGFNGRMGLVHGPRAAYAYAWRHVALTLGGGAEFTSRSLAENDESLTSGYGRVGLELRVPAGAFTFRAGGGGRAGITAQTLTPTRTAASVGPKETTKSAFVLGPEIVVGGRFAFSRAWFFDLAATGALSFLRQEDSTTAMASITGAASLGARF
jgi:hypothetical protein